MVLKFAIIFMLALSSVQSIPQNQGKLSESYTRLASELTEAITQVVDVAAKSHVDFNEISQLPEAYSAIQTIIRILTWIAELLGLGNVEIVYCIQDVVAETDNIESDIDNLTAEIIKLVRLLMAREERLAECDKIGGDNPSIIDHTNRLRCRTAVALEISTQTTRVTIAAIRLARFGREIVSCLGCIGPQPEGIKNNFISV